MYYEMIELQSLSFNRKYWTISKADAWLKKKNIVPLKPGYTSSNFIQYRIRMPQKYDLFRRKKTSKGVVLTFGIKKCKGKKCPCSAAIGML